MTPLVAAANKHWSLCGGDASVASARLATEIKRDAALRRWIAEAAIEVVATYAFERANGIDMGRA